VLKTAFRALSLAALLAAGAALAQTSKPGPNGGQLAEQSGHFVEFTPASDRLVFHFLERDTTASPMQGGSGRAIVQDAGKTLTVALAYEAPNKLVGKLDAPLSASAKIALSARYPDGHAIQARFTSN